LRGFFIGTAEDYTTRRLTNSQLDISVLAMV